MDDVGSEEKGKHTSQRGDYLGLEQTGELDKTVEHRVRAPGGRQKETGNWKGS
jgi:hypothetical protein